MRYRVAPLGRILGIDNSSPTAQYLRMISRVVPVAIAALLLLAAACDDGGGDDAPFVFTPEPYTVVVRASGTAAPITSYANGTRYAADEVLVTVAKGDEGAFLAWAQTQGFRERSRLEYRSQPDTVVLVMEVPDGSVLAAVDFIAARHEVQLAAPNYLYTAFEEGAE